MTSSSDIVFGKIREISARQVRPRPAINTAELARELSLAPKAIMPCLAQLKQMRLINFSDPQCTTVSLTMLGCTAERYPQFSTPFNS